MFRYMFPSGSNAIQKMQPVLKNKIVILVILIFPLISCNRHNHGAIKEGIIQFDVDYKINGNSHNFPIRLLPQFMEMRFNQNFISYTLKDGIGLFYMSSISNLKEHTSIILIKVFDKKYVYSGPIDEGSIFFHNDNTYSLIMSKDTLRLAGILCQKARIFDTLTHQHYDIAYSKDIIIDDVNDNTPYKDIEGLLMKFRVQVSSLDISFTARKYIGKKVGDKDFIIPKDYKCVSREQAEKIISSLLP